MPVDGDDVIVTGSSDITGGLDQSAITLASFKVAEGSTAKIGSASAALTFGHISALSCGGSGQYYKIGLSAASGEDGICTAAVITLRLGVTFYASGGTWTIITVGSKGGTQAAELVVDSTAVVTTLRNVSSVVKCTVSTNGTAITTCENYGVVSCRRAITTHNSIGPDNLTLTDAATMGTYNGAARSTYNHQSSGTVTTANIRPFGSFPVIGHTKVFTVTTINVYPGAYVNFNPSGPTVTYTTTNYIGEPAGTGGGAGIP